MELSPKQLAAVDKAVGWYEAFLTNPKTVQQVFTFTGYAGTGKTTAIHELTERLNVKTAFAAYTGKAARVISRVNDVKASTIHALIYAYVEPDKVACQGLYDEIHGTGDEQGMPPGDDRNAAIKKLDEWSAPHFVIKDDSPMQDLDLLFLDEASMVNQEMLDDLLSYGVPILAIGDPGQLPPVKGTGALFVGTPDVQLEEIFRQAAENPIIKAATMARQGIPWGYHVEEPDDKRFRNLRFGAMSDPAFKTDCMDADQVLCGMNKTREDLNVRMRSWLGYDVTNPYPQVGETLCCWKNDKIKGLYNGDQCTVVSAGNVYEDYLELEVRLEDGGKTVMVKALRALFDKYYDPESMKRVKWFIRKNLQEFDYGYALTVHKSQGSQWDKVLFMDDGLMRGWSAKAKERRQLVYTAVTRAAEKLTVYS